MEQHSKPEGSPSIARELLERERSHLLKSRGYSESSVARVRKDLTEAEEQLALTVARLAAVDRELSVLPAQ